MSISPVSSHGTIIGIPEAPAIPTAPPVGDIPAPPPFVGSVEPAATTVESVDPKTKPASAGEVLPLLTRLFTPDAVRVALGYFASDKDIAEHLARELSRLQREERGRAKPEKYYIERTLDHALIFLDDLSTAFKDLIRHKEKPDEVQEISERFQNLITDFQTQTTVLEPEKFVAALPTYTNVELSFLITIYNGLFCTEAGEDVIPLNEKLKKTLEDPILSQLYLGEHKRGWEGVFIEYPTTLRDALRDELARRLADGIVVEYKPKDIADVPVVPQIQMARENVRAEMETVLKARNQRKQEEETAAATEEATRKAAKAERFRTLKSNNFTLRRQAAVWTLEEDDAKGAGRR